MAAELRPMAAGDLERVLAWRNHEDTRRYMYSSRPIGPDEHRQWFERTSADPSRHVLILEVDGVPSGFVNIGPVQTGGVAEWGFYAAPGAPRGTGRILGEAALEFAFRTLGLRKLCGEVIAGNQASRDFHLSLGFRQEGVLIGQHFDGILYQDVVLFGLQSADRSGRGDASNF